MARGEEVPLEALFAGRPESLELFEAVRGAALGLDGVTLRVTKSQVAFRRRLAFAWTWLPGQYLRGAVAPLVLTVDLDHRDPSPRWKEVVEPRPSRFVHHLELRRVDEVDDEVRAWLAAAHALAG